MKTYAQLKYRLLFTGYRPYGNLITLIKSKENSCKFSFVSTYLWQYYLDSYEMPVRKNARWNLRKDVISCFERIPFIPAFKAVAFWGLTVLLNNFPR